MKDTGNLKDTQIKKKFEPTIIIQSNPVIATSFYMTPRL